MGSLNQKIQGIAEAEGIDMIRFVSAEPFKEYLLTESPRRDPRITLPEAKTLIVCLVHIGGIEVPDPQDPEVGLFSRLILSGFYFDVVHPLKCIAAQLEEEGYRAVLCDGYQDTSVLPLKLAAVRGGMGWQGKNSLLVTKKFGSFVALGGIITDAPLDHDLEEKAQDGCGTCGECKKSCPMGALDEPYRLNTDRCLSNLLEGNGPLPEEVQKKMGNMVLECDICQSACPWNKKASRAVKEGMKKNWRHNDLGYPDHFFQLSKLVQLTEEDYDKYLGYRLTGVDYKIFRRNVAAAMANAKK